MANKTKPELIGRRSFFRTAGAGAVGVVAAAVSPAGASEKVVKNDQDGRYQETEHVKTAYRTARF
jgi:hypothetical protein